MIEQLVGAVAFLILNGSNLVISRAAVEAFPERRHGCERVLIWTAAFLLSATAMVTLLGMIGLLNRRNLVIVAGLLGILATGALLRKRRSVERGLASPPPNRLAQAAFSALAGVCALWLAHGFFLGVRYRGDDLAYHGLNLGRWLLDQSLSVQTPAVQAYYPANSTAMALWFSIPFSSDAYAGLAGLGYGLLLALGVTCLLRRAGAEASAAAMVAAALLWSHQLREAGFSLTATDLAGPALIVAASLFTLPDTKAPRSAAVETVFAGLLAGSAAGVKPSFAIPAATLFLMAFLRDRKTAGFRFAASGGSLFLLAAVAAGGYWYLRNFLLTGNPIFPMENLFFSGSYPREALRDSTMAQLFAQHGNLTLLGTALRIVSDWPRTLGVLALVGYLAALLSLARRKWSPAARAEVAVRVLTIGAVWLIAYPWLPFSGGNSTTFAAGTVHPHIARFLILPFACGLTLAGLIDWKGRRRLAAALAVVALTAEEFFYGRPALDSLIILGSAFVLCFLLLELWRRRANRIAAAVSTRRLWGPACLMVLLIPAALWEPFKLQRNRRFLGDRYRLEGLLNVVQSWDRPTTSGVLMINYCYPLFGSRFQNDVVWLDPGGKKRPSTHEFFNAARAGRPLVLSPFSADSFLENVESAGAEFLMMVNFRGPEDWPQPHQFLSSREDVQLVLESPRIALWRLKNPEER